MTISPSNLARDPLMASIFNVDENATSDPYVNTPMHVIDVSFNTPITRLDITWGTPLYVWYPGCATLGPIFVVTAAGNQVEVPLPPDADPCSYSLTYRDTNGIVRVLAHPTPDAPKTATFTYEEPGGPCSTTCYEQQWSELRLRWDPPPAPPAPPPVVATASCTPAAPTRGDTIHCSVNVPGASYTVLRQRAKGKGFTIDERPNVTLSANQPHMWGGAQAVATSEVEFEVRYTVAGSQRDTTAKTRFDVQARQWDTLKLRNAPQSKKTPPLGPGFRPFPSGIPGSPASRFGLFSTLMPIIGTDGGVAATVAGGPNKGLVFLATQVVMPDVTVIWTHPELYGPTFTPSWFADQNGQGKGSCTQSILPTFAAAVEEHEGLTLNPFSHRGVANRMLANSTLQKEVEELYFTNRVRLENEASRRWTRWIRGVYDPQHRAFDNQHTPTVFQVLGTCTLDFSPPPGDP